VLQIIRIKGRKRRQQKGRKKRNKKELTTRYSPYR